MSIFLPRLQEKLIPIYFITRKGVPFYRRDEQQKAFELQMLQMHQCY